MKTNHLLTTLVLLGALLLASCGSKARVGALQTESQSVGLGGAEAVSVKISFGAGDLDVAGGAEQLLDADFTYNVAALKPEVKYTDGALVLRQLDGNGIADWRNISEFRNEWDLRLHNDVPMNLSVSLGGGRCNLQLAGLSLTGLNVTLGGAACTLDLGGGWARSFDITLDTGAADMIVILPGAVGVRVEVDAGPTMIIAPAMTKDGNVYTNTAYGVSDVTLQMKVDAGIGQIYLEVGE